MDLPYFSPIFRSKNHSFIFFELQQFLYLRFKYFFFPLRISVALKNNPTFPVDEKICRHGLYPIILSGPHCIRKQRNHSIIVILKEFFSIFPGLRDLDLLITIRISLIKEVYQRSIKEYFIWFQFNGFVITLDGFFWFFSHDIHISHTNISPGISGIQINSLLKHFMSILIILINSTQCIINDRIILMSTKIYFVLLQQLYPELHPFLE